MTLNPQALTEAALLPCPFCGGQAKKPYEERAHKNDGWWHVECGGCSVAIHGEWSEEACVAAWNTRAPVALPPISEGIVERLREALRDDYTDRGMEDMFVRWPVVERELRLIIQETQSTNTIEHLSRELDARGGE